MVTSCTPLIEDLFLYFYKIQCMTKLSTESSKFNSIEKISDTYRYITDIFSKNNEQFSKYSALIYPNELTLK